MSYRELIQNIDDRDLSTSLSRALRLAQENEIDDFGSWIRLELNGYVRGNNAANPNSEVPEYRSVNGRHLDRYGRPIVIGDNDLMFLNEVRLRNSVTELERLSNRDGNITIQDPLIIQFLEEHFNVQPHAFQFSSVQLEGVLNSIKTRLSDYLYQHREELNDDEEAENAIENENIDEELIELKPGIWGFNLNLKVLFKILSRKWSKLFK